MSRSLALILSVSLLLLGCVQPAAPAPTASPTSAPALATPAVTVQAVTPTPAGVTPATSPTATAAAQLPAWVSVELTESRTGEKFRLSDFKGRVVLLELFAVWCPVCTQQQREMRAALDQLGEKVVLVSLDVDPNEDDARVRATKGEFNWRFAVDKGGVISRELERAYGVGVLNVPGAPMVILDREGVPREARFGTYGGAKSSSELVAWVNQYA